MLMGIIALTSCKKDDATTANMLENNYFTVVNGVYHSGSLPASNGADNVGALSINHKAIPGGSSVASITTVNQMKEFYLGVQGVDGYLVVPVNSLVSSSSGRAAGGIYDLVLLISQNLNQGFTLVIGGTDSNGTVLATVLQPMEFLSVGTGALQVSLSFNNNTDVDLYVVRPNGEVIYYGHRGGYDEETESEWGLDLDSNPACSIDGINQENVYFPTAEMLSGKYEVWVNLYENCNYQETRWDIVATKSGSIITPSWGSNPATGIFAADAPSNEIGSSLDGATKVMEFTIGDNQAPAYSLPSSVSLPKTASALLKEEMSKR